MKKDISGRPDIELAIKSFYDKVLADEKIGFIFTDIAKVNWEKHLPIMYDFWENVLFFSGKYNGDPMNVHRHLNNLIELKAEHFRRWTHLFNLTIDELFEGENAERAKQRALSIATVMQVKLSESASKKE
ncbi:MAG: group III truncated hemoglobin [Bacteroidetes bacterium]|nr:group III truncated hemoglobin [Bacteroidota bacterium]